MGYYIKLVIWYQLNLFRDILYPNLNTHVFGPPGVPSIPIINTPVLDPYGYNLSPRSPLLV